MTIEQKNPICQIGNWYLRIIYALLNENSNILDKRFPEFAHEYIKYTSSKFWELLKKLF